VYRYAYHALSYVEFTGLHFTCGNNTFTPRGCVTDGSEYLKASHMDELIDLFMSWVSELLAF
jgi:hypothetical protein